MLQSKPSAPRRLNRSGATITLIAASLLIGGSVAPAAAKTRHHRQHHHHHHKHKADNSWLNANASIGPTGRRSFSGIASYYGNEAGSKTASGQRFNQHAMTAAHRTLPFGTKLKVTHGDRSVIVTVNDRGPFIRGRVLDLSKGAAHAIGLTGRGVGRVVAEVQ
ncbi:MAG: septal ring lytic transglycosylase RlpA family protein [Xanthobacteraceae bacterium]|nr:septal ring lytic transglycosylase RlpA family protein [Xanthobacteraceae bacterium]